jgi:MarR family transcriptional regulator, transcriptional regulator for hemolysin
MKNENLTLIELGKLMREIFRVFKKRILEQKEDEIRITNEQFHLLHAINLKEDEVIQKDMAEMMGRDQSAILRLIDTLEEKELVRRVADKNDRRKNYLMVTKNGERVIQQYQEIGRKIMEDMQQGLSESDLKNFHRIVNHLKSNAEKF